jgi:hypothetical protein
VIFHSRLLHSTGPNKTERHRRVMTVHYAGAQCKFGPEGNKFKYEFRTVRGRSFEGCV